MPPSVRLVVFTKLDNVILLRRPNRGDTMQHSHFFPNADFQAFADLMDGVKIEKTVDVTNTYSVINVGRDQNDGLVISVQGVEGVHVLSQYPLCV